MSGTSFLAGYGANLRTQLPISIESVEMQEGGAQAQGNHDSSRIQAHGQCSWGDLDADNGSSGSQIGAQAVQETRCQPPLQPRADVPSFDDCQWLRCRHKPWQ